ncbi:MAG: hypothetical protein IJA85_10025 [Clostridia bacterium]|nr:hypothetical protein [Clostridia bacterium]
MQSNKEIIKLLDKHKPAWYSLGFRYENPPSAVRYFCTPMRALIFASLGVDGIHYCIIPSLGDFVFVVNPMPADDRHVIPVAANLAEFLSLVHTLEGTQLLDQMILWDEAQFNEQWSAHREAKDDARTAELDELASLFEVTQLADPYNYVRSIADSFDGSRIEYSHEYYDTLGLVPVKHRANDFVSVIVKHIPKK